MVTKHFGLLGNAVLVIGVLMGPAVQAQGPAAPRKIYTDKTAFKLPLQVDEKERSRIREVQLHVKAGSSGSWALKEAVPATQKEFVFHAPKDGEYWFCVVTIDITGKPNPADVHKEGPGLIVVVDKQPPEIELQHVPTASGQPCLRCEVRDANPDPSKTKIEYQASDQSWKVIDCIPDQPGLYLVPDWAKVRGLVRASAVDLAGNRTVKEIQLYPTSAQAPAPPPVTGGGVPSVPLESQSNKAGITVNGGIAQASYNSARQLINSRHTFLKYQIDEQGPSGIGKVEVWMTKDEGQNWNRLCEDPKRQSPVAIDLPGEGVYGLAVVATNGNGAGGVPPAKGEAPDFRLEVDTTKPAAQLVAVRAGTGTEAGMVLVTWTASDKNLKAEPIDLFFSKSSDGPWSSIAKGLKNDGNFRWVATPEASGKIYVRLDASDEAGNTTTCIASQPLMVDVHKPKARILGAGSGDK
ncbi:MAG TPA: hypothetical protein VGY77_08705 [Gemmataceae bacterium]|jgi:hypothetical protein|nr:hypothetical protein [Gemmataceae bacterium]